MKILLFTGMKGIKGISIMLVIEGGLNLVLGFSLPFIIVSCFLVKSLFYNENYRNTLPTHAKSAIALQREDHGVWPCGLLFFKNRTVRGLIYP